MEIKLRQDDHFRVCTDQGNNFIDISGMDWERGIRVDGYPTFHYIEVREKDGGFATFFFKSKGAKHEIDLGWWQDAEVVFSRNNVRHDK